MPARAQNAFALGFQWQPTREGYLKFLVESKVVYDALEQVVQQAPVPECKLPMPVLSAVFLTFLLCCTAGGDAVQHACLQWRRCEGLERTALCCGSSTYIVLLQMHCSRTLAWSVLVQCQQTLMTWQQSTICRSQRLQLMAQAANTLRESC